MRAQGQGRQPQQRVEVELGKEPLPKRLPGPTFEQHVIRQDHRRSSLRSQHRHDVLDEVELLVPRGDCEVLTHIVLAFGVDPTLVIDDAKRLALSERRIGQNDVPALGGFGHRTACL